MNGTNPVDPVTLFYSYAHEDEALRDELQGHLKILERRGLLAPWHDRKIVAGQDWAGEIDSNLRDAELVLLLVSKDFVQSDYIWGVELVAAMERHAKQATTIVPIMVRPVDLDPEDAPFMKLQGLPTDLKPVTSWTNRDEAWTNVAKGLRATVNGIRDRRSPNVAAPEANMPNPATPSANAPAEAVLESFSPARSGQDLPKMGSAPAAARPPQLEPQVSPPDPVLEKLVSNVIGQINEAQSARNEPPMTQDSMETLDARTRALIDNPDQKRVLWVDDHPEGNRWEAAALAKLQIEVVTARSTDEALACVAQDHEGFDLVISDWERDGEPPGAGLLLLQRLRQTEVPLPIVYYHAAKGGRREKRATQARAAGASGEAVLPHELMMLVAGALAGGTPAS